MFCRVRRLSLPLITLVALVSLLVTPAASWAQQTQDTSQESGLRFGAVRFPTDETALSSSQAQYQKRHGGVGFGVKIGPLFSSLSGNTRYSNRTGLLGGIFFGGNRPGRVGVMGELLYAKKGISVPGQPVDLHYLEIPVLLRINVGSENLNRVSVYLLGGPVADVILKAKQNNLDVVSNYQRLDVGVLGGAGIEITRFLIEVRENLGLRSLLSTTGPGISKIHLRTFEVMAGIRFN